MFSYCFSLKLECEKLASEKIEIQRHYVMVSNIFIKVAFSFCVKCCTVVLRDIVSVALFTHTRQ